MIKFEAPSTKFETNSNDQNSKQYDLESRTLAFASGIRRFVKKLPKSIANFEDGKQLVRSSGSVGANYIEANESLSKKDFLMRIKISHDDFECYYEKIKLIYSYMQINLDFKSYNFENCFGFRYSNFGF